MPCPSCVEGPAPAPSQAGSTHLQLLEDALHGARPRRDAPRALLQACATAMHASAGR